MKSGLPIEVVRKHIKLRCQECSEGIGGVRACDCKTCAIYKHRPGTKKATKTALLRAIRAECEECVGTRKDICTTPKCDFFPFRMGRSSEPYEEFVAQYEANRGKRRAKRV